MVMNLTIDDTAGVLSYSSGWRIQPSSDDSFFQGTYHASESANQTVSVTFNGTAIYIYGSKGTTYGGFTAQVDNVVTIHTSTLPPKADPPVEYQQVIFADTFDAGTHLVELTTTSGKWVDIDYVILTSAGPDEGNPNPGSFSSTFSALESSSTTAAASSPSTPSSSSPSSSPSVSTSSTSSSSSSTATALAGVFGGLLGLVLLLFLIFTLLKRQRRKTYERERQFRRGPTRSYIGDGTAGLEGTEHKVGGGVFAGLLGGGGRASGAGGEGRSGTPQSGLSSSRGNATPSPGPESMMGVFNYAAVRPSQSSSGISPYGQYGMAPAGQGGGQYRQTVPEDMDPRHSIDFLSVRS